MHSDPARFNSHESLAQTEILHTVLPYIIHKHDLNMQNHDILIHFTHDSNKLKTKQGNSRIPKPELSQPVNS